MNILNKLKDKRRLIRKLGVEEYLRFKTASLNSEIIELLKHSDHGVQCSAAYLLGELRAQEAIPALIEMYNGETYKIIDGDGSPGTYHCIIASAAIALAKINSKKAISSFIKCITTDPHIEFDPEKVGASIIGLRYSNYDEKHKILDYVKDFPSPGVQHDLNVDLTIRPEDQWLGLLIEFEIDKR